MNFRNCQMKSRYCYLVWCGVQWKCFRVSNLEHHIWREINFSAMFCFILCISIQLFTPHQALLYPVGLYHTSALGGLVLYLSTQMPIIDVSPFVSMLLCAEVSGSCSFSERFSFLPRRQNFMLSQKREWKIKYPLLSDIFLCLYSKLNIIGHCTY